MNCRLFRKLNSFIFFFLLILLSIENVNAVELDQFTVTKDTVINEKNGRKTICLVDDIYVGAMGTTYDISGAGSNVSLNSIIKSDVFGNNSPKNCFCSKFNGACSNGVGVNPICNGANSFDANATLSSCAIDAVEGNNYTYTICYHPSYNDAAGTLKNTMTQKLNGESYTITMDLSEKYISLADNITVEYCAEDNCNVDDATGLPRRYDRIIKRDAGKSTFTMTIPADTVYYLVFKGDLGGACGNAYLGYYQGVTPSNVSNRLYNSDICKWMRERFPGRNNWLANFLYDCYSETISKSKLTYLDAHINEKWNLVNEILNADINPDNNASIDTFTCQFDATQNKKTDTNAPVATYKTVLREGKYWSAMCTEELYLEYDTPKAVQAGAGFSYEATAIVKRTCQPIQISQPILKDECQYGIECWGGPTNHTGQSGAGPNQDFDDCIDTCDQGTYTQECINSCYQKVYKNNKLSSISIKPESTFLKSTNTESYQAIFVAQNSRTKIGGTKENRGNPHTLNPVSSECVVSGNSNSGWWQENHNNETGEGPCGITCDATSCTSEHDVNFVYLDSSNGTSEDEATKCYEVFRSGTDCVDDPTGEFYNEVTDSYLEYKDVLSAIQKVDPDKLKNEIYTMTIDEKYNTNDIIQTVFSNTGSGNRIYSSETDDVKRNENTGTNVVIAAVSNDTDLSGLNSEERSGVRDGLSTDSYTLTRTINLKIGAAYITRDGSFNNDKGALDSAKDVVYNTTVELTDTEKDKNYLYFGPYNKYFTSFATKLGINNYKTWPYYDETIPLSKSTAEYEKNIKVELQNIGTWNQWGKVSNNDSVDIQCFYGTSPDDCGLICPFDDDKSLGGIQYIFRPIELTDVFPNNRDPRFNWTGTIINDTATGAAISKNSSRSFYYGAEDVNPDALTSVIQNKGKSIYDVTVDSSEVDYEFVLTKENIRNIRDYNKHVKDYNNDGNRNYLDYNMSCHENSKGMQVCTSRFLDNVNGNSGTEESDSFITYSVTGYSMDNRKLLAGCNNAINGTNCDTSIFGGR